MSLWITKQREKTLCIFWVLSKINKLLYLQVKFYLSHHKIIQTCRICLKMVENWKKKIQNCFWKHLSMIKYKNWIKSWLLKYILFLLFNCLTILPTQFLSSYALLRCYIQDLYAFTISNSDEETGNENSIFTKKFCIHVNNFVCSPARNVYYC